MNASIKTSFERRITFRSASIVIALASLALLPKAQAVVPPPDGGYPNFTTAEGSNALKNLTTGAGNTAVGWFSLFSDTAASFNTAVGAGTLLFNNGDSNTAVGVAALLSNTTGDDNTAVGVSALQATTDGSFNTAFGNSALVSNTTGMNNTATGFQALYFNTTGQNNTATGYAALAFNSNGAANTADGWEALFHNTIGAANTAIGAYALYDNTTGVENTALGYAAGSDITGNDNVCIGFGVAGQAGVNGTTWISNIWGQPGGTQAVYVDENGRLGANISSRRFKEEIKPMEKASEVIYSLKPVSFRYKTQIEPTRPLSFGLIAEDVEQINADLVLRGKDGKVSTVRYDAVNAMLLNEFLKEHRKVQELEKGMATLTSQFKEQAGQLQKVSALVEASKGGREVASRD